MIYNFCFNMKDDDKAIKIGMNNSFTHKQNISLNYVNSKESKHKIQSQNYALLIKLISFSAIYLCLVYLYEEILRGRLSLLLYENYNFNEKNAYKHLLFFCKESRIVGSKHYNDSVRYIEDVLNEYSRNAKNKFKIKKDIVNRNVNTIRFGLSLKKIQTITVTFKTDKNHPNLYIDSHIDGHTVGPTTYDDIIHSAALLEVIRMISLNDKPLDYTLKIIFMGAEEQGLEGVRAYVLDHNVKGHLLNLEAMASNRPFYMPTKALKSSSVMKTWAKIRGAMIFSYHNDIAKTSLITASSDLRIFQKENISGAEVVFLGNPSSYHTKFDKIYPETIDDIKILGNALYAFTQKFRVYGDKEVDSVGLGISPIIIVLPGYIVKILCILLSVISIYLCLLIDLRDLVMILLKVLSVLVMATISVFLYVKVISAKNPTNFSRPYYITFITILFFFLFSCFSFSHLPRNNALVAKLFIEAILCLVFCTFDTGLLILVLLVPTLVNVILTVLVTESIYFRNFVNFVHFLTMVPAMFTIYITQRTMIGVTTGLPGNIPDYLMYFLAEIMAFVLFLFFISFFGYERKKNYPFFTAIVLLLISATIQIPPQYNDKYVIKASFAHYTYNNGTSYVSCIFERGKSLIPFLSKYVHSNAVLHETYKRVIANGTAIVMKASAPDKVRFPEPIFKYTITDDEMFKVFNISISDHSNSSIYGVKIRCLEEFKCLSEYKGFDSVSSYDSLGELTSYYVKYVGASSPSRIEFITKKDAEVNLLFSYSEWSSALKEFYDQFPDFVVHYGKSRDLANTVYVYELK